MDACLTRDVPCRRYRDGRFADSADAVAQEVRLTVRLAGGEARRIWIAPYDPEGLALGHAALEMVASGHMPVLVRADGLLFELSSRPATPREPDPSLPRPMAATELMLCMRRFLDVPGLWDGTGCYHRAGVYDTVAGTFVATAEDISRHNCLDRLAGHGVRDGIRLAELALFLSCRVTASLMEKIARAGFRLVVSRSAVTEAAVITARENGISLIGFLRDAEARFTVFNDPAGKVAA